MAHVANFKFGLSVNAGHPAKNVQDLVAWFKASQPKAWEAIDKSQGAAATQMLAERLRKALDSYSGDGALQAASFVGQQHEVLGDPATPLRQLVTLHFSILVTE